MKLTFTVYGIPQPQGSAKAFMNKGMKYPSITTTNEKLKPWRQEVAGTALIEMKQQQQQLVDKGPISIEARFIFAKPKSTKKTALYKVTKPDLDKLIRALCDALSGIVFRDDAQVVRCVISKVFGEPNRMEVSIESHP